jgi:hypothetical protein
MGSCRWQPVATVAIAEDGDKMMFRRILASLAAASLLAAPTVAHATPRAASPIGEGEQIAGNPWVPWLVALLALVAIVLVVIDDDDEDEPVSP